MSEWGNPAGVMPGQARLKQIGRVQGTRGTETSQYPEEKKAIAIPSVVVSEQGVSLNRARVKPAGVACAGLWDRLEGAVDSSGSYKARG